MAARSVPDPVPPYLVRPEEAARRLSISVQFLYLLKDRGTIIFRKLGGATVIRVAELEALAASLPAVELDMEPTGPLLPRDQQQLAIELASERSKEPPKRKRGRPRRPRPEPPTAPEPEPAVGMMKSTGPLLPHDQQQLAIERARESDELPKPGRRAAPPTEEQPHKPDGEQPEARLDLAAMHEERVRLLTGNVGPDEARLRSFEYVVGVCRNQHNCDLGTAKKMVLAAIEGAAR